MAPVATARELPAAPLIVPSLPSGYQTALAPHHLAGDNLAPDLSDAITVIIISPMTLQP
jgi:hypothetical protein